MVNRMMLLFGCLVMTLSAYTQGSVYGVWQAIDDADGQATSHIEVYEQEGKVHGKIVKLLEESGEILCENCKGNKKDQPILGMEIMWGMEKKGEVWKGGKIMDPEVGKQYKCRLKLDGDVLEVRGYIGIPTLGRTQKWYRVK